MTVYSTTIIYQTNYRDDILIFTYVSREPITESRERFFIAKSRMQVKLKEIDYENYHLDAVVSDTHNI